LKPEGGTNTIYLIEIGGLRIAHFGDIGQEQLTPDQLDTLYPVDIAITQFTNQFSNMDMENLKGFRLMEQVKPRLIIPTHANRDAIQYALGLWPGFYSVQSPLLITLDQLPEQTSLLLLGSHAVSYMDIFSLEKWSSAE
jgi:L-ascorbate metabolism protein UlaG (beta-lactamase superfamily)